MVTNDEVRARLQTASREVTMPNDPLERLNRRRATKARRQRVTAGAVAVTLVIGGGLSLFALRGVFGGRTARVGSGGSVPTAPAPAGPDLTVGPGEYFYLQTTIVLQPHGKVALRTWWAPDGSGRIDGETYEDAAYGLPPLGTFGPGEFPSESDVSDLSTDPDVLERQLLERSSPGGASPQPRITPAGPGQTADTGPMWRTVKRLLEYPNALPELRAAVVKVALRIPGVEVLHDIDGMAAAGASMGRPADAVRLTIEGATDTIAFDPDTFQPLEIDVEPTGSPDEAWYEIFDEAIVGSVDQTPAADGWLTPPAV